MRQNESTHTPSAIARDWTKLEFSNDGKSLLVGTNGAGHFLLDAFSGDLKAFCARRQGSSSGRVAPGPGSTSRAGVPGQGDMCFSADGRYVVGGSGQEKDALVWDTHAKPSSAAAAAAEVLHPMTQLPFRGKAAVVEWNPRYNMMASADKEVVFWLPDEHIKA